MNQFFIEPSAVCEGKAKVKGDDYNHIVNVLRLRRGEKIALVDQLSGVTYTCSIETTDNDEVVCAVEDMQTESRELPISVTIYQGLPKSDKLEFVIQKAVEMGASRIVPVMMKRSIVKPDPAKAEKKKKRYQAIAESAASQSKRMIVPEVGDVCSFEDALRDASRCDAMILPYELAKGMDETRAVLEGMKKKNVRSLAVFIGPEGGFDESEVAAATECGAQIITLGNRILRTETAPIAVLAWLTYIFEL